MKSIAIHHFPRIVPEDREPALFNPILKKRFKNRPEERVRLKWTDYLLLQTDWPKSRIGFEAPVQLEQEKNTLRADLVLYNRQMAPEILIECKAESVRLTQAVAEQAARYNRDVDAPFICLTNGINDFWYRIDKGKVEPINPREDENFPIQETVSFPDLSRNTEYWKSRGFCAGNFPESDAMALQQTISHFWSPAIDWPINYLNFPSTPFDFGLQQYYRIPIIDNEQRLAITFLGIPQNTSHLLAILNNKGQNSGILSVNLNRLSDNHPDSATLIYSGKQEKTDAGKHLPIFRNGFSPKLIEQLPQYLMRFFV